MKFGISVSQISEVDLAVQAEKVGYDFVWVWDSPMIRSSLWSVLTLVADRTSTIRVGPGVAIPALRMAPVTANSIATINRLAPGRTFLGLGTGNTALRTMGQLPMKVADYAEHIRVIRGLLAGDTVDYSANGITHDIQFQSLDLEHIDIDNHIPLHVGGFGPRAQALAGELGDGLITGIPRGGAIPDALANVRRGADAAGRSMDGFETTALVNMLLLRPHETLETPRVVEEVGSSLMVNIHYLYDRHLEVGAEPPPYVEPIWEDYVAFRARRDAERDHTEAHGSHYGHLDPDEARFVTPEMIRTFCVAGQPADIVEQLEELEHQGLDGINFIMPADRQWEMCDEFAAAVIERMR
ncbi:MAG: LLM class flavin-dependent oxidoreductase [Actinomycetota bacterium]|jgi:5,10-methylenetetrahydromethanopterin reductase|nr:LLM class flavin-dependent oxidoreductase [Actinomycetota bacterium]